jgi:hypothetical protein
MPHSLIMRLAAVVSLIFGLSLLFAPNALLALYKAQVLNSPGIYNSMLLGGYLIAVAIMNWSASKDSLHDARHVILGTLVAVAIGLVVALQRQLTDPGVTPAAWANVVIFLVLSILYGYLQFGRFPARGTERQAV